MNVKKLDNIILVVVDELRDMNEDMIDDLSRMNKGLDVAVYYTAEKRLVLQGDKGHDVFQELVLAASRIEE